MSGNVNFSLNSQHLSLKRKTFLSEKSHNHFAKSCVRLVRSSVEYREWSSYVKDVMGYKTCVFTNEVADQLTIDIHHHPLSLFDIVNIVINTYLKNQIEFSSPDISKDVLLLHYTNNVGYVPLISSLHEKYHNGYLSIPPKFIVGKWNYLTTTSGYVVDDDIKMKVSELMKEENNKYDTYFWHNDNLSNEGEN
jgi:hypothetical protein